MTIQDNNLIGKFADVIVKATKTCGDIHMRAKVYTQDQKSGEYVVRTESVSASEVPDEILKNMK
jgi:hypothetical protein